MTDGGRNMNEKELWERITAVEQSLKSVHHRIDNIERLTESVYTLATEVKKMRTDLDRVCSDVDELQSRPLKRIELIANTIVTALTGGIVGYILGLFIGA